MSSSNVEKPRTRKVASKSALRWNAVLTIVLLLVIAVLGNVVSARHLRARHDLSEDGLYALSDATRGIVDKIEDRVTVRLFATEDIAGGQLALRSSRIRAQLEEILGIAPRSFELQVLDPSRSTEARTRAREAGFTPVTSQSFSMGSARTEAVWLSIELGYRGRTERIGTPQPWKFETDFASALHGLLSDRRIGIGWYGASIDPVGGTEAEMQMSGTFSTFTLMRREFQRRGEFQELFALETGRSVPDEVDVLFVVRPGDLPERALYELDQFVQRGGSLIVCLDDPDYSVFSGAAAMDTEDVKASRLLSQLLGPWGIGVSPQHIWDAEWRSQRLVAGVSGTGRLELAATVKSPTVITVPPEGLNTELPPTQGLDGVQFSWAHPLATESMRPLPKGVTRTELVKSSEKSWLSSIGFKLFGDNRSLNTELTSLRTKKPESFTIGAVFAGRFPSYWAGKKPPVIEVPEEWGLSEPPLDTEPPRSGEVDSQIVVIGDADWLRDPWPNGKSPLSPFALYGGVEFALNLVDWLTLDEALIGLRSRRPSMRPLRDFVSEAERDLGLEVPDLYPTEQERMERAAKMDEAREVARRKQWMTMLVPALAALAIIGAFGLLWNLRTRFKGRGVQS